MKRIICLIAIGCLATVTALAQDAAKVDAKHYKVVFQDSTVRVLRVHYGPHEKSPMHSHPNATAVFLTDMQAKFTMPDGKTEMMSAKAGEAKGNPAVTHSPENTSDKPMDLVLVEFKTPPAAPKAAAAPAKKTTK
jgi:quercetin dioxygenase-like cupin family protein